VSNTDYHALITLNQELPDFHIALVEHEIACGTFQGFENNLACCDRRLTE